MNELKIFNNEEFGQVRTLEIGNKEYFVGSDVAKSLGYAKPQNAISAHCKGALKWGIPTNGGIQEMLVISEGDVFRLITKSELPQAEKFEKWVFDEVLPEIRRTGSYNNQLTLSDDMVVTLSSKLDAMVNDRMAKLEEKCKEYFRPVSKEKSDIVSYIKKRLGISKINEEYELVKERVLIKLSASKWEDVPVEVLRDSLNIIDESIAIIKAERKENQVSIYELNKRA